ncbi:hypothetical protein [Thermoflavimicrobium dichotomicum]|uniref:Uncharacterized protein n=1 Tax=Thermoflavimicrobium dichotomicum TaxID=46223 RepID=A0A1I3PDT3_9BACL|nr:hypothetical protein [Thermoflavimicrobium dichotomicum]SFJ19176.1 hypothetical protein SAMN05421852_105176 [Thermoflavimicrobium dichotomicum]
MNFKSIASFVLSLFVVTILTSSPVYAVTWERIYSDYWSGDMGGHWGKQSTYAPNSGEIVNACDWDDNYIEVDLKNTKYSSSSINAIHNYYYNNGYRHTIDFQAEDGDLGSTTSWYYTNYPDPYPDVDDDIYDYYAPGAEDEFEVTAQRVLSMNTSTNYYLYAQFHDVYPYDGGDTGYMTVTAQQSFWGCYDECGYQSDMFDELQDAYYDVR